MIPMQHVYLSLTSLYPTQHVYQSLTSLYPAQHVCMYLTSLFLVPHVYMPLTLLHPAQHVYMSLTSLYLVPHVYMSLSSLYPVQHVYMSLTLLHPLPVPTYTNDEFGTRLALPSYLAVSISACARRAETRATNPATVNGSVQHQCRFNLPTKRKISWRLSIFEVTELNGGCRNRFQIIYSVQCLRGCLRIS